MSDKEILHKIIMKAKLNGFNFPSYFWLMEQEPVFEGFEYIKYKRLVNVQVDSISATYFGLNDIIFSHDFAKAFWGTQEHDYNDNGQCKGCCAMIDFEIHAMGKYCWEEHLCDMVLEPEPLKYIAKFL